MLKQAIVSLRPCGMRCAPGSAMHRAARVCVVMGLLVVVMAGCGGTSGKVPDAVASDTAPMLAQSRHPIIEATINGQPVRLLVDTGSNANLLSSAATQRLGLQPRGAPIQGDGAGGPMTLTPVLWGRLTIAGMDLGEQPAFALDLPPELLADGVLGAPALAPLSPRLDFSHRAVTFTRAEAFSPPQGATRLPLRLNNGIPLVEATVGGVTGWFEVDSGSSKAAVIHTPVVDANGLRQQLAPVLRMATGGGVGGYTWGDIARAPRVTLGDQALAGVITELSLQTTGALSRAYPAGQLGNEIWRRFIVTVDYAHAAIYLHATPALNEPFAGPRAGFSPAVVAGRITVVQVVPGSPADLAGMTQGDELLAVDGQPLTMQTLDALWSAMAAPPGTVLTFALRSPAGTRRDITLTLRELL